MSENHVTIKLENGIATNAGTAGRPMEDASAFFVAPAADGLGGRVFVAVVADGIGSPARGALASRIAVDIVQQYFNLILTTNVSNAVIGAMEAAHNAVRRAQDSAPEHQGMKSTLTIAVIGDDRLLVGSLGNSRLYLVREGEIHPLTSDRTWSEMALRSRSRTGNRRGVEPPSPASTQFLGAPGPIKPLIRPVEFLWPGDIILLCTDGLDNSVSDIEMRNILVSADPQSASTQLVQTALDHGAEDNITAVVIRLPGNPAAIAVPLATAPPERLSRLSRTARFLILANLLLLFVIGFMMARSNGAIPFFRSAEPTIQVAEPALITPTPGLDAPLSVLGQTAVPGGTTPAARAPAAAPTLGPDAKPTFTPIPVPTNWTPPPPPILLSPANGSLFTGPDANVILSWDSVGSLPNDVFYVLVIRRYVNGTLVGETDNWSKATRIKLDSSFYTAISLNAPQATNANSGNIGQNIQGQPLQAPTVQFQWYVVLKRLTSINPDGSLQGVAISSPSQNMMFLWGPSATPSPTTKLPAPAPTRVYGSDVMENDPFFAEVRQREESSSNVILPVSASMASFSVLIGLLGAWPKFKSKRRGNRGERPNDKR